MVDQGKKMKGVRNRLGGHVIFTAHISATLEF